MNDKKPRIVCLCGSTRFSEVFQKSNLYETLAGHIVLSIGCDMRSDAEIFADNTPDEVESIKANLDELHLRKIDLADEVLILNVGGYVGESTRREWAYAVKQGKHIRWHEPNNIPDFVVTADPPTKPERPTSITVQELVHDVFNWAQLKYSGACRLLYKGDYVDGVGEVKGGYLIEYGGIVNAPERVSADTVIQIEWLTPRVESVGDHVIGANYQPAKVETAGTWPLGGLYLAMRDNPGDMGKRAAYYKAMADARLNDYYAKADEVTALKQQLADQENELGARRYILDSAVRLKTELLPDQAGNGWIDSIDQLAQAVRDERKRAEKAEAKATQWETKWRTLWAAFEREVKRFGMLASAASDVYDFEFEEDYSTHLRYLRRVMKVCRVNFSRKTEKAKESQS